MLNYNEFQEKVLNCIREKMGAGYKVDLHKVTKNNDVELMSIMIQEDNDNSAIPTIYLEDFYEQYCVNLTIEDIANQIIGIYRKYSGKINISIKEFEEFDGLKNKIMLKLINYERNKENLKDMPHKRIMDLAIVCYVFWEDNGQRMTTTVRKSHLELWNIGEEELYEWAYRNTYNKELVEIRNIKKVIYDIYNDMKSEDKLDKTPEMETLENLEEAYPMYVLSNKYRTLGAIMMLNKEALNSIYEKIGRPAYILPSSIHEVIVVPKNNMSVEEMVNMVMQINENELDYMEVLSDNVYVYDGEDVKVAQ